MRGYLKHIVCQLSEFSKSPQNFSQGPTGTQGCAPLRSARMRRHKLMPLFDRVACLAGAGTIPGSLVRTLGGPAKGS
jgi:hypothetical protein